MSISINIIVPNEEVSDGRAALERRMAVLGYSFGVAAVPVIGPLTGPQQKSEQEQTTAIGADPEDARAEEAKAAEEPKKRGRKPKADEKPQISTQPENRVEPEAVDDDETGEQDAADEAAEVEAHREPETPLTIDDVKNAMGLYVQKFGMEAIQADGPAILVDVLGPPPQGETSWKLSLLSGAHQETLAKVIGQWKKVSAAAGRFGGA